MLGRIIGKIGLKIYIWRLERKLRAAKTVEETKAVIMWAQRYILKTMKKELGEKYELSGLFKE